MSKQKKLLLNVVIPLIFIFLVFAFLRFYNLDKRIGFGWDQEQFSTQIQEMVKDHKLTLLGPRVTDDKGFFLGPYFTYLLIPFYLITNLHPSALTIFLYVVNVSFFALAIYTIKRLFNLRYAFYFLFFWAINPILVHYDTTAWNPILIPLGVMIVWLLLFKIYKEGYIKYWALLGICLGLFLNMHFQFVFIIGFAIIYLIIMTRIKKINFVNFFILMAFFLGMFLPIFIFDLRHNFLNAQLFLSYFTDRVAGQKPFLTSWFPVFQNFMETIVPLKHSIFFFIIYLGIIGLHIWLIRNKKELSKIFYKASLGMWILTAIGFSVYGRRPSEYYFIFLYPFIYIMLIDILILIGKEKIIVVISLILIIINFQKLKELTKESKYGLYYKDKTTKYLTKYKGIKFRVSYDIPIVLGNGFEYLIAYYEIKTDEENVPLVQIRVPPKKGDITPANFGIHIPQELQ